MLHRRLASASLIAGFLIGSFVVAQAAEPRALLELFTSQGCSSCPAADKLLGELVADPSLVALSLPIDYWDYLGWRDTLASPADSARQRAYAHARGDRQVYTPQIVVNGSMHVLGSDKAAIEHEIASTDQERGVMSVPVSLTFAGNALSVKVEVGGERAQYRRSLALSARQSGRGRHRARREPRPHHHLSQRRPWLVEARRLDRQSVDLECPGVADQGRRHRCRGRHAARGHPRQAGHHSRRRFYPPAIGGFSYPRNKNKKGRQRAGLRDWGMNHTVNSVALWPDPSAPRGAGGLRNPEHDPNRALRQQGMISQSSEARAWPKWGRIMIRLTNA